VAIIMRTKDRPALLDRALTSVLSQSHAAWRLYIANDGGDRRELEDAVARHDKAFAGRVTVLHHDECLGRWTAANTALSHAAEDFVIIHDDDDSWQPDFLATTTAFLTAPENSRYVGVLTGCTLIYEKIEQGTACEVGRTMWMHGRGEIDFRTMLVENQFPPICFLFRRSAVDAIGGFNSSLSVLGDWEYNIRLLLLGDIGFIDSPLANYHHRLAGAHSAYGNTVVDGAAEHRRQNTLLRNAMLRTAIGAQPEALGLLQPVLHALAGLERRVQDLQAALDAKRQDSGGPALDIKRLEYLEARLQRIETAIAEMHRWLRISLRPARWIWKRLQRLRRLAARIRGRTG
jgi:glycosyltransferase involved in cell wall biosynthesis